MPISVTEAELLEALANAAAHGPDAQTATEMAEATGVDRRKVMRALHEFQRQGRLQVHQVIRPSIAGKNVPVPAYSITKKKR